MRHARFAANSYLWLILSRVALGAVTATTGPTIASLTGDFFPAEERGRMYGLILGGELVGTGIGFVISGDISAVLSWRYAFWWLALPSIALAWLAWRLPEPARGGQSRLRAGDERIRDGDEVADQAEDHPRAERRRRDGLAARAVRRAEIEPQQELVLRTDPSDWSVWTAIRYVLRVRTNVVIIAASALGCCFFFSGLRSFAIIFATRHYALSKPTASALVLVVGLGALAGVFFCGRLADRMLRRGNVRARVLVPALCLLAVAPVLAPTLWTGSIAVALPLLTLGAALLGAPNPPMDAARLDIIHPRLWGRAEGVRTVFRALGEAVAPTLFGYVSEHAFGGPGGTGVGGSAASAPMGAVGLEYTFLLFVIPLLVAGLVVLPALRTYPRDVATATASADAISPRSHEPGPGGATPGG